MAAHPDPELWATLPDAEMLLSNILADPRGDHVEAVQKQSIGILCDQTVRAFGLVGWMRRQRLAVNKWLETEAGQALVARMPMLTIKTLYRCATRAAVAAKVKDEDEWGRSIYMHALAQVM